MGTDVKEYEEVSLDSIFPIRVIFREQKQSKGTEVEEFE